MAEDLGTRAEIAEGTSHNLAAAVEAGLGEGNVPEIFDYFLNLTTGGAGDNTHQKVAAS